MNLQVIDAELMQKAIVTAARSLEAKKEWINELNVFPVPDGDTGTNMTMTIMSAAREAAALENPTVEGLCKAISSGSLRGARGNSGVILSQLFRGFLRELKTAEKIDVPVLASAFGRATETAYKAVMKPKEGTILTVARGMSEKAAELADKTDDICEFCEQVIAQGDYVLSQTPELLPVLKQAGVVDSGGQGLMQVVKGAYDGLTGRELSLEPSGTAPAAAAEAHRSAAGSQELETADIKFGYCTEFIINLEKPYNEDTELEFKAYLESLGDCVVVVSDDDIVKVHVHTNDPGLAIQKALTYGSLSKMKIDNMREEHHERLIQNAEQVAREQKAKEQAKKAQEPRKATGFLAVSAGDGMAEIFKGIGADDIIQGGQTMNPSTEDILNAVDRVNADTVYILPNNKNIILAAQQAAGLVKDKKLVVVPSKTVPQGITALINFLPDASPEENLAAMEEEMALVRTGQITYAVRNTVIDGTEIHEGDIMGLGDSGILAVGKSVERTALDTLKAMLDGDSELVSIYYGSDVSKEDAEHFFELAKEACAGCEAELHCGGQPIYYYMISVE